MALRFFQNSFVAVLVVATVVTFAQAGVLELVPISEIGVAQELGVARDTAAWVSEDDGAGGECFSDSGAVLSDEGNAEIEEADDATDEMLVSVSIPVPAAAMNASAASVNQPGDVNGDGYVNQGDVDILASNWQHGVSGAANATRIMGDLNDDGKVDGSDVTILAFYWGAMPIPVPEPSTVVLLLCGTLGLIVSRHLRKA